MIHYYFIDDKGRKQHFEFSNMQRVLYIAASHHEQGYYIEMIRDGNTTYTRNEVLLLCHKYNLL